MGLGDWYEANIVPRLIRCACGAPAISATRMKVVPLASGRTFEIGCGGGLNQAFLDASRITAFAGIDPSAKGLDYARAAVAQTGIATDLRQGFGEVIPFDADEFDSVVCTFTLCSVQDQARTLSELRRILKPGGRLLFAEHGRAPDASVRAWQHRIEPVWKRLTGGCHLTRPVGSAIKVSGFTIAENGQRYAKGVPRWAGWIEWGVAVKAD